MGLSKTARRKLGNLAEYADRTVAEMIRDRGGSSANVRHTGNWADRTLGATAEAAAHGDMEAASAIKIVKQAKRLGEKH